MRRIAAAVLGVLVAILSPLARFMSRRSTVIQFAVALLAVSLVVGGLLVALPTRQIQARAPTPYDPPVPTAQALNAQKLNVDDAYVMHFTKPMNQGSVAANLAITPQANYRLSWDGTGEVLSITPATNWQPFTTYKVDLNGIAMDQAGMQLGSPVHGEFTTGDLTSGKITATAMVGNLVAPSSSFQLTFSRPVKLATVQARLTILPPVTGTITGDDPTDVSSQVFTFTPGDTLAGGTMYMVKFDSANGTDANGVALLPVNPLSVTTAAAPEVVRFRPANKGVTADPNQVISVRFTVPMDRASTAAAFSVVAAGKRVRGAVTWVEGDTVMVLDPNVRFSVGTTVYMALSASAKSKSGQRLSSRVEASFRVVKPVVRVLRWSGGIASRTAPWHSAELYMLQLLNCTRTGGWVTYSGTCSSVTHHVLPAQGPFSYNSGIANRVARPYAKALADRGILTHYLGGTSPHSRLTAAGYPSSAWGENLTQPPNFGAGGMISSEIFFQNEYRCASGRCEFGHYYNVMAPFLHQAGIGVWVTSGRVRLVIDFYG